MTERKLAANRQNRKVAYGLSPHESGNRAHPCNTALMQRMEASNSRQLVRLTNMMAKVKRTLLKNTAACHYVLETKWFSDEWWKSLKCIYY